MKPMNSIRIMFWIFLSTALCITAFHFLFHPVRVLGMDTSIFYMDEKVTLSAYFTVVTYFLTGAVALMTLDVKKTALDRALRFGLALFFLMLSLDEYFELHEYLDTMLKGLVSQSSVIGALIYYSWIFPFALVILLAFASLVLLAIREKRKDARAFLIIGLTSYAGILLAELIGGSTFGLPIYLVFVGVEEGLEMISAVFFLRYVLTSSAIMTRPSDAQPHRRTTQSA